MCLRTRTLARAGAPRDRTALVWRRPCVRAEPAGETPCPGNRPRQGGVQVGAATPLGVRGWPTPATYPPRPAQGTQSPSRSSRAHLARPRVPLTCRGGCRAPGRRQAVVVRGWVQGSSRRGGRTRPGVAGAAPAGRRSRGSAAPLGAPAPRCAAAGAPAAPAAPRRSGSAPAGTQPPCPGDPQRRPWSPRGGRASAPAPELPRGSLPSPLRAADRCPLPGDEPGRRGAELQLPRRAGRLQSAGCDARGSGSQAAAQEEEEKEEEEEGAACRDPPCAPVPRLSPRPAFRAPHAPRPTPGTPWLCAAGGPTLSCFPIPAPLIYKSNPSKFGKIYLHTISQDFR